MKEFINELEYNKKINEKNNLQNIVNIDYVIEKLKDINILKEYLKGEISFYIESLMNCEDYSEEDKELLCNINEHNSNLMVDKLLDNDYLWDVINDNLSDAIYDVICEYLEEIEEVA